MYHPSSVRFFLSRPTDTLPPPAPPRRFPYTTLFRSAEREFEGARAVAGVFRPAEDVRQGPAHVVDGSGAVVVDVVGEPRSEEHTSELQSRENLVCRLLPEKKTKRSSDIENSSIHRTI